MQEQYPDNQPTHLLVGKTEYRLIKDGARKFIADDEGNALSDRFHDFEVISHYSDDSDMDIEEDPDKEPGSEVLTVIGTIGSARHILSMPKAPGDRFETLSNGYHEIRYRSDLAAFIAKIGALTYLLDSQGKELTQGHHRISVSGGKLFGTIGSQKEELDYDSPQSAVSGFLDKSETSSFEIEFDGSSRARLYAAENGKSGKPRWMEPFSKVDMFGKPTVFSDRFGKL